MDRLSTLLSHFGMSAGTFHSGELCGLSSFDGAQQHGHLHLLRSGGVTLRLASGEDVHITEPTLIFFPALIAIGCFQASRQNLNWSAQACISAAARGIRCRWPCPITWSSPCRRSRP